MVISSTALRRPVKHPLKTESAAIDNIIPPWGFPEWFIISQTAIPAILYLPGTQAVRLPLRVATFGVSLVALWWYQKGKNRIPPHPAEHWLIMALLYLFVMVLHPTTNSTIAGLAQVMLYLSVLAPVFWVPFFVRSPGHLYRVLAILLVCNGINSSVGVLQVYDPATWMPTELSQVVTNSTYGLDAVSFVNSAGERMIRPPGLSDNPGAVCGPGMIAALLGLVFAMSRLRVWKRIIALMFAITGVAAIYLSQVRTAILILGGMLLIYGALIFFQRKATRALTFFVLSGLLLSIIFTLAISLGGEEIGERFATLTADDPVAVYYEAQRGEQLEYALTTLLPEHPFGAGLGRWGMMRYYFGDESNTSSPMIWAELQIPAWLLDGGLPLLFLYSMALISTCFYEVLIAKKGADTALGLFIPAVVAANIGTVALVFGFTPFTTQLGLQYWFLVGALHGVAQRYINPTHENLRPSQR